MNNKIKIILFFFILISNYGFADNNSSWEIIPEQSSINFSGKNAGSDFAGVFTRWDGKINFHPDNLATSSAVINIDLNSVNTKNKTYNSTLHDSDWLDTKITPQAVYKTASFIVIDKNKYNVYGNLTIRNITVPVDMTAEIIINNNMITINGQAVLNRLDFTIGKKADPKGEWVSLKIPVVIKVIAKKTN